MEDLECMWNKLDVDFFRKFINLHSQLSFKKKTQSDFNKFVLDNKAKFDNPAYLKIFSEIIELSDEQFYENNYAMCKVFYDFLENNPEWNKLNWRLRIDIRLRIFQEKFKEFILRHQYN
ncbi:hypothetical protein OD350_28745 (plasmid) [Clostridium beijerinckii]|uniref:hypothetical protein n=1 Tax=Clostridium beijerinckii TaxID=1520 RepID=UPI002226A64E|nr:hypothetical protein [Clostridium beijerinckii]UYZ39063.1 hypothetical protein OD350_28745 [Clostridium beijerinckii]